ncbi:penicillin-binding protein 1C [Roseivivax sediminis]|nr:penicillin-binding protein 1C [Roseivivax sediminis]
MAAGLAAGARDAATGWIDATVLPTLAHATSDEVRARDGTLLRAYTVEGGLWRMRVAPGAVDPALVAMLVAYEDKRFFDHAGVDPRAVLRAAGQAVRAGRIVSGASTLTMQVARLLEDSGTGAWAGKLRQMRVALALERRLSKDEIVALYLHLAPYGGNIEGVRAATLAWFGKEPRRLTPAEAALLVALPQAPEGRRPDRAREAARSARSRVLARVTAAGVLDAEDAVAALRDPLPEMRRPVPMLAPHLADRARAGGVTQTTLDASLQARLERLAAAHLAGRDPALGIAILVADHRSGEILASVGSRGLSAEAADGFVDMTRARRSPGSTLKPLVYGLAFDRGLAHPETIVRDTPVRFGIYAPQNFDGRFRGEVTMRAALQASLNIPVVRIAEALGPAHLVDALRRAGAARDLAGGAPGLAVSLGGVGLTLEELTGLYAMLARGGEAIPLRWHSAAPAPPARILSSRAAWQVGHVLAGIVPPGGGAVGQVAYKTGTSYGHRDAWALGFDGAHVAGVWIGRPDGTPVPGAFGGDLAAPLLFEALALVRATPAPLPPPPPDALLLPNAQLPQALRRFGPQEAQAPALDIAFPPDGATLAAGEAVPLKLRGGTPPYTVLTDSGVAVSGARRSEIAVPTPGAGFTTLSVIDAAGHAARLRLRLE